MADEATETPTTDAADVARAQAEARRRRILEQAQTRMGVVSGEVTQDEDEKQQSASKAARIRAARARRYGKKSTAATTTTEDDSAAPASETPEEPKEETPVTNDQPPKPEPNPAPVVADYDDDDDVPADEKAADTASSVAASQASDDTGTKKKYLGVAKMRRKMIQKKKMEEAEAEETPKDAVTDAKETPIVPPTASVNFSPIPIYMHFFTILLLFLAGLDVGFQQYHPNVQVHSQFVVAQHGLPLVHRSLMPSKPEPVIVVPEEVNLDEATGDEFEEPDVEEVIPNIDPIFRVDLDQLTQGPGFFNQIARGAVGVHRAILALFALPLTIFQSVIGMPQALLRFPPVLCVLALIIRQLVGKMLLGASIPETESKSKGGTDVLEMVKNFVNGFLKSTFPTFVGMYDAFSHLKSDMYVILFGVFCGFIMGHWQPTIPASGTDEL